MLRLTSRSVFSRSTASIQPQITPGGRRHKFPACAEGKGRGGANQPAVSKTATKTRPASPPSRTASRGNGSATRTKSKKEAKTLSAFITERFDEFSRSQKDV